jgi:hypothetical protein
MARRRLVCKQKGLRVSFVDVPGTVLPGELPVVEGRFQHGLDDCRLGRHIEVAWHEQGVMANVQDFVHAARV